MNGNSEERGVREVEDRLRARFPELHPAVVREAIHTAHGELTGPVREYVPVLVEHMARDRLTRAARANDQPDGHHVSDETASTPHPQREKAGSRRHRGR